MEYFWSSKLFSKIIDFVTETEEKDQRRRTGVKKTAAGSELRWEKGKKTESPENDCTGARKKDRRQETEAMIDRMA
ncbi:hypothetical protein E3N88_43324 [Mikania micrantha]|uniref:Uncharacterized protein n=1 Tax=Mikania micrantha TaxID=192012 RepID=A0A5N6LF93_9ASTR|nr:hypothetical protein E3N88_43324 [Mikania micrantha]